MDIDSDTNNLFSIKKSKKVFLSFLLFLITLLLFSAITYAWFVGTDKADINSFTVSINTDRDLEISLDGYTWDENITVDENKIMAHSSGGNAYENNKNKWVGEDGLVPISSSGDNYEGFLDIYSKSAMIGTDGGYKLIANKISNYSEEEDYYVSFDIFVKNKSGDRYNANYNIFEDENIFLTTDSVVTSSATGEDNYGIQNSVRVAFVQVGRINIDDLEVNTTPDIKCEYPSDGDKFTPLCDAAGNIYNTVIWEPNELDHDDKLLEHYNLVCKTKALSGTNITYGTDSCSSLDTYNPTYTIKRNIITSENVDIYDGLNSYYSSIQEEGSLNIKPLQNTSTYTDTMKNTNGDYTLMMLAPHSVTKIRVYVYLEGQDVDNYDLITNDLDINVSFGFTKERNSSNPIMNTLQLTSISPESTTLFNTIKNSSIGTSDEINFNITSSDSNTNGVYKFINYPNVYFYRGQVDNNVIFGNYCWKIIRTTSTGGVKLIYNGSPVSGKCTQEGEDTTIGLAKYNNASLELEYYTMYDGRVSRLKTGYTYNYNSLTDDTASEYNVTKNVEYDSIIKQYIDDWYENNLIDYTAFIEDSPYCNDRRIVAYDASKIGATGYNYFASSYRSSYISKNLNPSLNCNNSDSYTVSSDYGNGKLTYPVALLTGDEAILAGFSSDYATGGDVTNSNIYLDNDTNYFTMTPVAEDAQAFMNSIWYVFYFRDNVDASAYVRPVISLKSGLLVTTGDGTVNNPYIIQTN